MFFMLTSAVQFNIWDPLILKEIFAYVQLKTWRNLHTYYILQM